MSNLVAWLLIGGFGLVLGTFAGLVLASRVKLRLRRQSKEEQVDSTEKKLTRLALEMETWNKRRRGRGRSS